MNYSDKKTFEECSFFEKAKLVSKLKYFRFQIKIIIISMIFIVIPSLITITLYIENDTFAMRIFSIIVIFMFIGSKFLVDIIYIFQVYSDCLNNSEKSKRLYKFFKKYEHNELIQFYEMQKGTFNSKPNEYLKIYNEKLLDRSFLDFNNSEYIVVRFFYYQVLAALNEIVLKNNTDYNFVLSSKLERLNKIHKSRFKKVQEFTGALVLEKVILAYKEKNYEKVFEYIKEYFTKGVFTTYDLRKVILIFLYVSAKKSGNEIDFLHEIGKKRLQEALQEEEFSKFVQRELGEDL